MSRRHCVFSLTRFSEFPSFSALHVSTRCIIVPLQLKAYGGTFSRSIGERSNHLVGDLVLQSLSPSSCGKSPLLSKNVKTKAVTSFEDMSLCKELRHVLQQRFGITTPSPIQQTAIEVILQRKDTVVAAPHGEGKTLAYLLPLYQNMLKDRDVYKIPLRERRPRMLLLAPTRELVSQLQHICSVLGEGTGLRAISFTSRSRSKYHLSRLLKKHLADVVIMDPKMLLRLIRTRRLFLDDVRYVAVDEADVMLSSQHDHNAVHLLAKINKRVMFKHLWPVQTQTVFATAFVTRKLEFVVGKRYQNAVTCLQRQRMHRPCDTLRHRFFPVGREQEKMDVLQFLLKKHGNWPREICTDVEEIQAHTEPHVLSGTLAELVARRGVSVGNQKGVNMPSVQREKAVPEVGGQKAVADAFAGADGGGPPVVPPQSTVTSSELCERPQLGAKEWQERARHAIEQVRPVCWEHLTTTAAPFTCHVPRTVFGDGQRCVVFMRDIESATAVFHRLRGCGYACSLLHASLPPVVRRRMFSDFASGRTNILCATDVAARGLDLHIDVVINFNMPTNALSYLSRAGRTARQGRLGRVYSLYTKRQGVIVSAIRAFLQHQVPLEGVSNWKQHMTRPRYAEWRTHKMNAIARSYISLITQKTIPAHLERTYLRHNATWRPLFHPQTSGVHGGVPPRQQQRIMDAVMRHAVWFRRGILARRKGGRAKFGSRAAERGVWNDVGGIASREVANAQQDPNPGGADFGPPRGPPL
ncbi:DEAD DEAH box helicase Helicase conserved C terminal domain [Trypanosoma vivax]|nr:ATP-dependent DEAD/H RNA helicase [Trypanosoma vivax]KAH8605133.1 DEAD DEAH box helicase Helicase conserved C terminal domain [Trypanosoma vivax]